MSRWLCRLHDTFMSFAVGRPGTRGDYREQIVASWTEITGQPAKQLIAGLTEIDAAALDGI